MFKIGSKQTTTSIPDDYLRDIIQNHIELININDFIIEQPVYPEWRENIRKREFIRAVQGTVAIEGSDIELEEVERIAERNQATHTDRDKEAENALNAYEFIQNWSYDNQGAEITEPVIKQIHTIMTRDISYYLNEPGQYRNQIVRFGYPSQESALRDIYEVQDAMSELIKFINTEETYGQDFSSYSVTKAILAHYFVTAIHPFIDGNGRVARAVEALILHHYGNFEPCIFPVTARFYYKERKQYFQFLRHTDDTGDPILFVDFAIKGLRDNLFAVKRHLLDQITRTLIMDYAHSLRRRKELLKRQTTLLENMFYLEPMELNELWRHTSIRGIYENLSESTRKRDLSKLASFDLVKNEPFVTNSGKKVNRITVNWDALRSVTLRLDVIPHSPKRK